MACGIPPAATRLGFPSTACWTTPKPLDGPEILQNCGLPRATQILPFQSPNPERVKADALWRLLQLGSFGVMILEVFGIKTWPAKR